MDYARPFPLLNPREPQGRARAAYNPAATTAAIALRWERGELVEVEATNGFAQKCTQATPASILRLAFAAADWNPTPLDPTRYGYYTDRGVPLETVKDGHLVVFTYQGATADASDHEFANADLAAVRAQVSRELAYNTAQGVLTIRDGATNPAVKMRYVFRGEVGDNNVRVACELLPRFRYEV